MSGEQTGRDTIQAVIKDWGHSYNGYYDEHAQPDAKFVAVPLRGRKPREPLRAGTVTDLRLLIEADQAAEKAGMDRADALPKVITEHQEEDSA